MGSDKRWKTCLWGNGMQMYFCIPSGGRNGVAYENDRNREIDRYADGTGDASQTPLGKKGFGRVSGDLAGVGDFALQCLFWKKERGIHNRYHMCFKLS